MKYKCPLLAVEDMEASKKFYKEVLGLHVVMDLGANVTLTGGLSLQTKESWAGFLGCDPGSVIMGGKDAEIYFEEEKFDEFIARLEAAEGIRPVHPVQEQSWGQRTVRFYDPDRHIIEVGEDMKTVCGRFLDSGMTVEEVAKRMDVPVKYVNAYHR